MKNIINLFLWAMLQVAVYTLAITLAIQVSHGQPCKPPQGEIIQNIYPPNCFTIPSTDTITECYSFTAPGAILFFPSIPAGSCSSIQVSAKLYDASCNLIQANAFGIVYTIPGMNYNWCLRFICIGTHDTIFCPMYQDFSAMLPVEYVSFTGKYIPENNRTELTWVTASESNNNYFSIETSFGTLNFMAIGQEPGNGTTNIYHHYQFNHDNPAEGVSIYRIKQVDFDGNYKYSNSITVVKPKHTEIKWTVFDITGRFLAILNEDEWYQLMKGVYIMQKNDKIKKYVR